MVGGIQTRTVKCKRNDGIVVDDYICNIFAGTKPATQSSCNTQPCIKCEYDLYHTLWGYNNWMDHSNNTCSQTVFSDVYITINDNQICTRCTSYTSTSVVIDGIEYSRGKKRDYPQWGNNCLNHYEVCY